MASQPITSGPGLQGQDAPLAACSSFSITRSSEKLEAFWRGG
jgi:hypothetical protein